MPASSRPTLASLAGELSLVREQLAVNTAATINLNDTVERSFAPKIKVLEEQTSHIVPREEHERERWQLIKLAAVALIVVLVFVGVGAYYTIRHNELIRQIHDQQKVANMQREALASDQRRTDLAFCYAVKINSDALGKVFNIVLANAADANDRAQKSPTATAQVKELAAESLAKTLAFVAQAKAALPNPDCSKLPAP